MTMASHSPFAADPKTEPVGASFAPEAASDDGSDLIRDLRNFKAATATEEDPLIKFRPGIGTYLLHACESVCLAAANTFVRPPSLSSGAMFLLARGLKRITALEGVKQIFDARQATVRRHAPREQCWFDAWPIPITISIGKLRNLNPRATEAFVLRFNKIATDLGLSQSTFANLCLIAVLVDAPGLDEGLRRDLHYQCGLFLDQLADRASYAAAMAKRAQEGRDGEKQPIKTWRELTESISALDQTTGE